MAQEVLAVVAGHVITEEELAMFVKGLPREQQIYASNPQFRNQCIEQITAIHMFAAYGEEEKLNETEEFEKIMKSARTDILAQLAMNKVMGSISVTVEEIKEFYEDNKAQFKKGETVSANELMPSYLRLPQAQRELKKKTEEKENIK